MDPAILKQLALGVVPPGLAAAALATLLWRAHKVPATSARWALMPVGLGVIALLVHPIVFRVPAFPVRSAADLLTPIAVLSGFIGWGVARARPPVALLVPLRAGLAAAFAVACLRPMLDRWDADAALALVIGFAGASALAATALDRVLEPGPYSDHAASIDPHPGLRLAALLVVLGAASQIVVLGFYSLRVSQGAGVFAALAGGLLVAALFWRPRSLAGVADALVLPTAAAVLLGAILGQPERPVLLGSLLAASPVAALGIGLALRRRKPVVRGWAAVVGAGVPALAALAIAALARTPSDY